MIGTSIHSQQWQWGFTTKVSGQKDKLFRKVINGSFGQRKYSFGQKHVINYVNNLCRNFIHFRPWQQQVFHETHVSMLFCQRVGYVAALF